MCLVLLAVSSIEINKFKLDKSSVPIRESYPNSAVLVNFPPLLSQLQWLNHGTKVSKTKVSNISN